MKRIFSPIIYIAFLIPTFVGFIVLVTFMENTVGFLFDLKGLIELPLFTITFGSLLFWVANVLIFRFEKLSKPTGWDHLRQSVGFYVVALAIGFRLWPQGFNTAPLQNALLFAALIISAWAVIINATYIVYRRFSIR